MRNTTKKWLVAVTSAILSLAVVTVVAPQVSSAATPDGHRCDWWFPYSVPAYVDWPQNHINYTQGVYCDGLVNSITITVEILYHGPLPGPGTTVNGRTDPFPNVTSAATGVATPGPLCTSGYYSGRATATVHFRSWSPEYITRDISSSVIQRSCTPGHIPTPTVTVIPPAPFYRTANKAAVNAFTG